LALLPLPDYLGSQAQPAHPICFASELADFSSLGAARLVAAPIEWHPQVAQILVALAGTVMTEMWWAHS
jgi:hypothetical protein